MKKPVPTLGFQGRLGALIASSLVLYAAGTSLSWHLRQGRWGGQTGRWLEALARWRGLHILASVMRFLYFVGVPAVALFSSITLPRFMGLTGIDWFPSIVRGTALGLGGFALLALGWLYYISSLSSLPTTSQASPPSKGEATPRPYSSGATLLITAIYLEVHWAFYRSLPLLILDDRYTGVVLGFLMVVLEWFCDPAWRWSWGHAREMEKTLPGVAVAAVMAVIYLFTQNLWLCVPIHWLITVGLSRLQAPASITDLNNLGGVPLAYGILWDMDGVLIDTGEFHYQGWQQAWREEGVDFSRELFLRTFGERNDTIVRRVWPEATEADVIRVGERKEYIYRELVRTRLEAAPGVRRLLGEFREARFLQAVATSAPPANVDLVLDVLDICPYFDTVLNARDVQRGKPDPQIFLTAAGRLGLPPAHCLVIEDAISGVQAARIAGMRCLTVTTTNSREALNAAGADLVVDSLVEVKVADVAALLGIAWPLPQAGTT
jgi:HAD superfamily hydrolase (TIGR01509 family)